MSRLAGLVTLSLAHAPEGYAGRPWSGEVAIRTTMVHPDDVRSIGDLPAMEHPHDAELRLRLRQAVIGDLTKQAREAAKNQLSLAPRRVRRSVVTMRDGERHEVWGSAELVLRQLQQGQPDDEVIDTTTTADADLPDTLDPLEESQESPLPPEVPEPEIEEGLVDPAKKPAPTHRKAR